MSKYVTSIVERRWVRRWREFDRMIKANPRKATALTEDQGELLVPVEVMAKNKREAAKKVRAQNPGCTVLGSVKVD